MQFTPLFITLFFTGAGFIPTSGPAPKAATAAS